MDKESVDVFINQIRGFLKEEQIITDKDGMSHFCYDATEMRFMPDIVLLPCSSEEVSKIMKLASRLDLPVTPQGGRTGLSGGALPVHGGLVLSLLRMNKILEIDQKNMQIVVEPGVIAEDLQIELKKYNLFFPPDPSSTVESTLGGNVAENAGYTRAVKYGVTRDYVLGLEAVLPDGEIINIGGRTVKNVTGYDLVALLIGSEGTLAIVTKIICKVLPRPAIRKTCIMYLDDLGAAADLVVTIFGAGILPCAIEFMDSMSINCVADYLPTAESLIRRDAEALVLVEVDGNHEIATDYEARRIMDLSKGFSGVIEAKYAENDEQAEKLWRIRRDTLPALKAKGKDHLEADVVVPRYRLPFLVRAIQESVATKTVKVATFGHAGDGNLHVTIQYRKRNFAELEEANELLGDIYRKAIEMGGKLTGEHGVGITAKDYMKIQMSPAEIALMKRIKYAFDPKGILNPGKIFPEESG
ncbi:MAG TPA: FAD-linked oxidase C-terminal domain-containing protein [Syntrophorhabdus sp.]|jgi:glycolate oxidase|nr:FAD-binding protein [Syntrophorhabdus sp.]MDI9557871.1 FAD-linked oxidase C-terminal domain-containing protein [Pseudomonadota bacterium]OPX95430.1 MAG: putative FAD-linked oxidoreductase [Syntrophorhabdus sp. PtaB.Bin027]OQB75023.1 MAG: putative FAD-linked oxidoreductase [Deltaproteobacteria bacterium ADurb.Bin135]MBP8745735.1 FAD-binding protein [Syntrophorhabdus sp.]